MPFLFSKCLNIVNDHEQTMNALYMSSSSSRKRFVSILIVALILQNTKFSLYISFQMSRRVFLGLSTTTIYVHKKCFCFCSVLFCLFVFSFKLFRRYIDYFSSFCELITVGGSNLSDGCKKYCGVGK